MERTRNAGDERAGTRKWVWCLHAALACILTGLILHNAKRALPGGLADGAASNPWLGPVSLSTGAPSPAWSSGSVSSERDPSRLEPGQRRFVLNFAGDIVDDFAPGTTLEQSPVRLEPDVPVACRYLSKRRLEVATLQPLKRATRYRVHPADDRRGRPIEIRTSGPRLRSAVIAEPEDLAARDIAVTFDLPIALDELRRATRILDGDGQELNYTVATVESPGEHAYRLSIAETTPPPDVVSLRVADDLRSTVGDVLSEVPVTRRIAFLEPLTIEGITASSEAIHVSFNHRLALPSKDWICTEPELPVQLSRSWRGLRLDADLPPGESVTVYFAAGFPGTGRARFAEGVARSVRIPDAAPALRIAHQGRVLSSRALPRIEVEGVNVEAYDVRVRSVYPNNLVRLAQSVGSMPETVFAPATASRVVVAAGRNRFFVDGIDLESILGGDATGTHLVEVAVAEKPWINDRRLISVTDLGVTLRCAPGAVAVHVSRISNGGSVAGATVEVFTPTNQELVRGVTDDSGMALLRYERTSADRVPYLAYVRAGEDMTYLDVDAFDAGLTGRTLSGKPYLTDGCEAHLWPDRGVVRPGEEMRAACVVRDARGRAPIDRAIEVRWIDPDGKVRRRDKRTTPSSGLLLERYATEPADATGAWRVEVHDAETDAMLDSALVRVEAFVPDRLEVDLELPGPLRIGGAGSARITARWLEGGAAAGQPLQLFTRYDAGAFAPEGYDDFSFDARREGSSPPGARPAQRAVLDGDGRAVVTLELPPAMDGLQALRARVSAEVSDPSGRAIVVGAEADVLRDDFLVGVRAIRGTDDLPGDRAEVVLVTPEGEPYEASESVTIRVEEMLWSRVRDPRGDGNRRIWKQTREVVEEHEITIDNGRGVVALSADRPDWYGYHGRSVLAIAGPRRAEAGFGRGAPERPDRLHVVGPTGPVVPGTTTQVFVDCPEAGELFVSVEGDGIHALATQSVTAGRNEIAVPIPDGISHPNVHVVATFKAPYVDVDGSVRADAPRWRIGGAAIAIAAAERIARVDIDCAAEVLPQSSVAVAVQAPGATQALVALVDEGILRITKHGSPDPNRSFLARRRLDTLGADTGRSLYEGSVFETVSLPGGGGGAERRPADPRLAGSISSTVDTVALISEVIRLDEDGAARVVFDLPPYEGRLRVMVIAAGPGVVGAAADAIVVRAPLGLRLATPRFVAPGDTTELAVTLRNSTGEDQVVELSVEGSDAGLPFAATVALAADVSETLHVPVTVGGSGPRQLDVRARAGDIVRESVARLQVRPPTRYDVTRRGFATTGRETIRLGDDWEADTMTVELSIDDRPSARLIPTLDAILQYPYGCAEQTSSRGFAALACRSLLPEWFAGDDTSTAESYTVAAIDRVLSMQTGDGGIGFWPGASTSTHFASLYAFDFLVAARDAGFDVDARSLDRLANWTENRLASAGVGFRAWAVEILSRQGTHRLGRWLDLLEESVTTEDDRLRLASTLTRLGELDKARELMRAASRRHGDGPGDDPDDGPDDGPGDGPGPAAPEVAASRAYDIDYFRSRLVTDSLWLRTWMKLDPSAGRVAEVARRLGEAVLRPGRLRTLEQGQILLALATYYKSRAAGGGAARATILVDGVECEIAGSDPTTRSKGGISSVERERNSFALDAGPGSVIEIHSEGGVLYGLVEVSGHRRVGGSRLGRNDPSGDDAPRAAGGLSIARTIIDERSGEAVTDLQGGRVYRVRLEVESDDRLEHFLVTDIVPGGCEIENPRLRGGIGGRDLLPEHDAGVAVRDAEHVEIRDDRVLFFETIPLRGTFAYSYRMRAVFPGDYECASAAVEALYEPGRIALSDHGDEDGRQRVEVRR